MIQHKTPSQKSSNALSGDCMTLLHCTHTITAKFVVSERAAGKIALTHQKRHRTMGTLTSEQNHSTSLRTASVITYRHRSLHTPAHIRVARGVGLHIRDDDSVTRRARRRQPSHAVPACSAGLQYACVAASCQQKSKATRRPKHPDATGQLAV